MTNLSSLDSIIDMDGKVSPIVLAGILGLNVSVLYSEAAKGRLPSVLIESTYRECIQMYVKHFKKVQDVKLEQERNERELKELKLQKDIEFKQAQIDAKRKGFTGDSGESDPLHPLVAAKMKQEIRLGIAKEAQLYQKLAIEKEEYINISELYKLVEPLLQIIKTSLTDISDTFPETSETIDENLETLKNFGQKLVEQAKEDKQGYIDYILAKDIDVEEIEVGFN